MILGKLQYDFTDGQPNLVKPLTNIKNEKVNEVSAWYFYLMVWEAAKT